MKVDVQSYISVGRPPTKFHRIRSPFDAPTDNYSDHIVGQTSDIFGLRKQSPGLSLFSLLILRPSAQSTTYRQAQPNLSRQPAALLSRASEIGPGPDPDSRHRWIRNIPKHLQNIAIALFGLPNPFISDRPILIGRSKILHLLFSLFFLSCFLLCNGK